MVKKKAKDEEACLLQELSGATKEERLQKYYDSWFSCSRCTLKDLRCHEDGTPQEDVVFCSGNPNAPIMIVGEAPGEEEAVELVPFVGRSGKLLNQILATVSQDPSIKELHAWYTKIAHTKANEAKFHETMFEWRNKHFFLTNVVACHPPDNRAPTPPEIEACRPRLHNLVYEVDPLVIITSGGIASSNLIGHKILVTSKRGELFETKIQGHLVPVSYPTIVTLHPSYLLRKADWNVSGGDYTKTIGDYAKALRLADFLARQRKSA